MTAQGVAAIVVGYVAVGVCVGLAMVADAWRTPDHWSGIDSGASDSNIGGFFITMALFWPVLAITVGVLWLCRAAGAWLRRHLGAPGGDDR